MQLLGLGLEVPAPLSGPEVDELPGAEEQEEQCEERTEDVDDEHVGADQAARRVVGGSSAHALSGQKIHVYRGITRLARGSELR